MEGTQNSSSTPTAASLRCSWAAPEGSNWKDVIDEMKRLHHRGNFWTVCAGVTWGPGQERPGILKLTVRRPGAISPETL
ncbi:hypothetical protein MVEN_00110200 [Mycena venus]|uniref:Uncharacterized protein n=1 Tax=Mycena venus TaxID=2733690 RepID=A0A8H6ZB71_9AGAR|nr:hypothetical protein MVEN_00110200 [Mycena venus]